MPETKKSILLVEDDPEITKLLNLHFDKNLYHLTSCSLGREAVEKFFSALVGVHPPDRSPPPPLFGVRVDGFQHSNHQWESIPLGQPAESW